LKKEIEVILNSTNDAIIAVDRDEKITLFNRAAEKITGYPASEVLNNKVGDFIKETRLPEILKNGESELNRRQALGNTIIITNRIPVTDEEGIIIGAVAIFRDITEMADLNYEIYQLNEMQSMLEAIFNATQDAISVCDEKGMVVMVNPAYTDLTGLKEEEIIGKHTLNDIVEGKSVHLEVLNTKKAAKRTRLRVGKHKREVISSAAPIIVDGILKGSVGVLHDVTDIKSLTKELTEAKKIIRKLEAKYTFDDIIGDDEKMFQVLQKAKKAGITPVTVLLRGESGTGKELFAHSIHNLSDRKYNQFVRVNCAAISESLLESELFGYEEGAFTGARKGGKIGLFEEAHGGTIFLDEIGEIPVSTQVKLLRVLQEKEIMRVGGTKPIPIDVRVIAATNAHLEDLMRKGKFREDLYYRLNVFPIVIPPLRDRKADLYPLVMYLVKKFNLEYGRNVNEISEEALNHLKRYNWPGNVRELQNFIGRTLVNIKYQERLILKKHLPKFFDNDDGGISPNENTPEEEVVIQEELLKPLKEILAEEEKKVIGRTLQRMNGNRSATAKALGLSLRNLYYKMEKYKL
jgi:PAS domain S-box-containing protein